MTVNPGYNTTLPSKKPFMYIEREEVFESETMGKIGILAHGAYNALGLIGTEMGGVAFVHEDPNFTIATKLIPHDELRRDLEFTRVSKVLADNLAWSPSNLVTYLRGAGYDVRFKE